MKRQKKLLAIVLAFMLITALLSGCAERTSAEQEEILKPVNIQKVHMEKYTNDISISGNIKPAKTVKAGFKVPGVISSIYVEEGDVVSEGQNLMMLDQYDYELGVIAAKSQYDALNKQFVSSISSALNQAEANLSFVKTQCDRVKRLYEKGAVAKKTVEELETTLVVAENKYQEAQDAYSISESQLRQAEAGIELAQSKLDDTVLKSPISGTVVKKVFESGETVSPGYPAVVLGRLDELEVEIGVSDNLVGSLSIGQKVKVFVYGLDKEVEGTIKNIDTAADTSTRTFGVNILIDNSDMTIKPGMIAKVTIEDGTLETILVPVNSVINNPNGSTVFICEGDHVKEKTVELGEVLGNRIQILKGIEEGEKIVVDGQYRLKDGDKVKVGVEE